MASADTVTRHVPAADPITARRVPSRPQYGYAASAQAATCYGRPMARRRREAASRAEDVTTPDQLLLDLVNGLRELDERVATLERRFDALGGSAGDDGEEGVMELRLHLARLSGELTRVTVELRGQIAELAGRSGESLPPTPELAGDEAFEDLTADSPARARERKPEGPRDRGWQPAD